MGEGAEGGRGGIINYIQFSVSPSSELRSASPLKGEAVTCAYPTRFIASPSRGEAERSSDEGDRDSKKQEGGIDSNANKIGTMSITQITSYPLLYTKNITFLPNSFCRV